MNNSRKQYQDHSLKTSVNPPHSPPCWGDTSPLPFLHHLDGNNSSFFSSLWALLFFPPSAPFLLRDGPFLFTINFRSSGPPSFFLSPIIARILLDSNSSPDFIFKKNFEFRHGKCLSYSIQIRVGQ